MIDFLTHKITFHLYSVLPYLSFLIGLIVSLIFFYFYFFSKNKVFLYFFYLALFASFYNICMGKIFYIQDKLHAVFYLKLCFLASLLTMVMFIITIYKILEKDYDKYIILISAVSFILIILNFQTLFIDSIFQVKGQYRVKPTYYYFFYYATIYLVFIYGISLLIKNIKSMHNNINIPLFVESFFKVIILLMFLSVTDALNIIGFVKVPPLFSAGSIIYLLAMLFEVAKSNVIYYEILKKSYLQTIVGLADLIDSRDKYTFRHSYRVSRYAVFLAEKLKLNENQCHKLKTVSLLHDIGKIGVPDKILLKEGKLNSSEWEQMKKHPEKGESILQLVSFLREEAKLVRYHHERYDGKGYPDGLEDKEIPLIVSLLSVADCFDAMTSDRPYRNKLSLKEVYEELKKNRGRQFSKEIVDLIIKHWDKIVKLYKEFENADRLMKKGLQKT